MSEGISADVGREQLLSRTGARPAPARQRRVSWSGAPRTSVTGSKVIQELRSITSKASIPNSILHLLSAWIQQLCTVPALGEPFYSIFVFHLFYLISSCSHHPPLGTSVTFPAPCSLSPFPSACLPYSPPPLSLLRRLFSSSSFEDPWVILWESADWNLFNVKQRRLFLSHMCKNHQQQFETCNLQANKATVWWRWDLFQKHLSCFFQNRFLSLCSKCQSFTLTCLSSLLEAGASSIFKKPWCQQPALPLLTYFHRP